MQKFCGFINFNRNYIREELLMRTITEKMLPKNQTYIGEHAVFADNDGALKRTVHGYEFAISGKCNLKNPDELKMSLIKYGYTFSGNSYAEIVLYSYIHYGESCVGHICGEVSFAVWDSMRQRIFIYHNASDTSPLFYAIQDNSIIFANELSIINNYPHMSFKISKNGMENLLLMQDDIFTNLFSLCSGQYMLINRNGFVIKPLFEYEGALYKCSPHYCEVIKNLLLPAVSSTLNINSSQKSKSTSDIIRSINYDKTDTDAFKKIISNAKSPLLALFDATKLYTLSDSTLPSDELLKEHLIKINCLFENYNIRMI